MPHLPQPFDVARTWTWADYEPYVKALLEAPLSQENVDSWIADWGDYFSTISEVLFRLQIAYTQDTTDEKATKAYQQFTTEIQPKMDQAQFDLSKKLVESGAQPTDLGPTLRIMRGQMEVFREENLPLKTQEEALRQKYMKIIGAQTVEWEGEEITVEQIKLLNKDPDRSVREKGMAYTGQPSTRRP